jgi:ATP-dependent RNA helicase DDX31/DBP7
MTSLTLFEHLDRILELGFGKEIEEILDLLGSRQIGSVGNGNQVSSLSNFQGQNLLLSATLNEKVNHLAKISLENPVMIGLDDKKIQPDQSVDHIETAESDEDDGLGHSKVKNSSTGDYKLPAQLVQRYVKGTCSLKHICEPFQLVVDFGALIEFPCSALWFTACGTFIHSQESV